MSVFICLIGGRIMIFSKVKENFEFDIETRRRVRAGEKLAGEERFNVYEDQNPDRIDINKFLQLCSKVRWYQVDGVKEERIDEKMSMCYLIRACLKPEHDGRSLEIAKHAYFRRNDEIKKIVSEINGTILINPSGLLEDKRDGQQQPSQVIIMPERKQQPVVIDATVVEVTNKPQQKPEKAKPQSAKVQPAQQPKSAEDLKKDASKRSNQSKAAAFTTGNRGSEDKVDNVAKAYYQSKIQMDQFGRVNPLVNNPNASLMQNFVDSYRYNASYYDPRAIEAGKQCFKDIAEFVAKNIKGYDKNNWEHVRQAAEALKYNAEQLLNDKKILSDQMRSVSLYLLYEKEQELRMRSFRLFQKSMREEEKVSESQKDEQPKSEKTEPAEKIENVTANSEVVSEPNKVTENTSEAPKPESSEQPKPEEVKTEKTWQERVDALKKIIDFRKEYHQLKEDGSGYTMETKQIEVLELLIENARLHRKLSKMGLIPFEDKNQYAWKEVLSNKKEEHFDMAFKVTGSNEKSVTVFINTLSPKYNKKTKKYNLQYMIK